MFKSIFVFSLFLVFRSSGLLNTYLDWKAWDSLDLILDSKFDVDINSIQEPLFKQTALHFVALNVLWEGVDYLLSNKANPNVKDFYGNTPLHYIVKEGRLYKGRNYKKSREEKIKSIVEALIFYGAEVNLENNNGFRPLDNCFLDSVKDILVENGAKCSNKIKKLRRGSSLKGKKGFKSLMKRSFTLGKL
jgi:ankyrin repeat protein